MVRLLVNHFLVKPFDCPRLLAFKEYTKKAFSTDETINFRLKNALNISGNSFQKSN
jgi:hypothetical protein